MNKRFKKGQIAEQCFKDLLNKKQIPFVKLGREFQIKNKQIESFLNKDNSPTAAAVRYSPDFLLLKNGLWFAEIKHSRTIEFNCYMNYKRLEESGCNVIIIFYINDNFYLIHTLSLCSRSYNQNLHLLKSSKNMNWKFIL